MNCTRLARHLRIPIHWLDSLIFIAFFAIAIGTNLYKSREEKSGEDFFLAGRSLLWPLIGLSLIAANISTEHFVGMSGQGAGTMGLAVASYEWIAAVTLVFVALFFLPRFLRSGIYTIPEYLEYRYNAAARAIMAFYLIVVYIAVSISAVVYSGALTLHTIFGMDAVFAVWLIGGIAALYTTWGGLKAVAWADLFLGSALILGGVITLILGFQAVGGVDSFLQTNADKLHMILPGGIRCFHGRRSSSESGFPISTTGGSTSSSHKERLRRRRSGRDSSESCSPRPSSCSSRSSLFFRASWPLNCTAPS